MAETTTPLDDDDAQENARQHMRNARREMRESFNAFFPPEFVQHQRQARREMLLAWRSMLDRAIQRIDDRLERADRDTGTEL